jgi:hypothetical protein
MTIYANSVLRDVALNPIWQEEDGCVLVDAASLALAGEHSKALSFKGVWDEWAVDTAPGPTGRVAYRWGGPNLPWNPGSGILRYRVHLRQSGRRTLSLRSRFASDATADLATCFVRVDGGQWWITRGHAGAEWGWGADHARSATEWQPAWHDLDEGFHQIEVSGRANGFCLDRLALAREGVAFSEPNLPPSLPRPR